MQEVEIKALLTEEKYQELKSSLPDKFRLINKDNITTIKFKPKDVRVRYSDKINELVFKDGDPTVYARKEISINLKDKEDCMRMISFLEELGLSQEPSWTKTKHEFICERDGAEYSLSLQHIPNFAYLLEAERMSNNPEKHIPVLKSILRDLGCTPLDADEFKNKIKEYIETYSK